jgi:hypothetical protein
MHVLPGFDIHSLTFRLRSAVQMITPSGGKRATDIGAPGPRNAL